MFAVILTLITSFATANVSRVLSPTYVYGDTGYEPKLVIQDSNADVQAVLITKTETTVYNCFEATADEHECYGFGAKPYEEPSQLNVSDVKIGGIVVSTKLKLAFLGAYAAGNFTASDEITRRFSIDSYTIESCE